MNKNNYKEGARCHACTIVQLSAAKRAEQICMQEFAKTGKLAFANRRCAFTLAEVLITLAIIGVVAALTIPSVILNTNQQEYKTGLKKAVSVLNQTVSLYKATDNMYPGVATSLGSADEFSLMSILAEKMNILSAQPVATCTAAPADGTVSSDYEGCYFKTTDGMTFYFPTTLPDGLGLAGCQLKAGAPPGSSCGTITGSEAADQCNRIPTGYCEWVGSSQPTLNGSTHCTPSTPCYVLVDVNGDRKPNITANVDETDLSKIKDRFYLQVTDNTVKIAGKLSAAIMMGK